MSDTEGTFLCTNYSASVPIFEESKIFFKTRSCFAFAKFEVFVFHWILDELFLFAMFKHKMLAKILKKEKKIF